MLVLRVWSEDDSPGRLRARINACPDVSAGASSVQTASGESDILALVASFLVDFSRRANPDRPSPGEGR